MKIVHVLPAFTKGGAERVASDLANHAAGVGFQVTVVVANPVDSDMPQDSLHPGVQVKYVSDSSRSRKMKYIDLPFWFWCHRSWLLKQDIIHCHLTYGAVFGFLVWILRNFSGSNRPTIIETYHAVGMRIPRINRWFHSRLARFRDAWVLMAEDKYWNTFLIDHPKLLSKVIPNGVPISEQERVNQETRLKYRREIGVSENCEIIVGTVGNLRPDRQPWLYIPVFAEIARALGTKVHFVIAGGGAKTEFDRLRSLIVNHGLEGRVHLPGLSLNPNLPRSIMDLYITLNVGAITGIAALEAAAAGLPVLAIQTLDGYERKVDDWIWSSANSLELAGEIIKLLRLPSERQALAEKQMAYVKAHHTIDTMAQSYYQTYQLVLDQFQNTSNMPGPKPCTRL